METNSFNPHPASLPGDAAHRRLSIEALASFNPHPASLPGDALAGSWSISFDVFQSAPGIAAG